MYSFSKSQLAEEVLSEVMAEGSCDLHLHTSNSDGSYTTRELIDKVLENRLKSFAITDHDTTAAIRTAQEYIKQLAEPVPKFIPGIEISVDFGQEVHLLGYFPYGGFADLNKLIHTQQTSRNQRNNDMVRRLQKMGYDIDMNKFKTSGDGTVGRLQAAQLLTKAGYTPSVHAAFKQLLNPGKPAYIERERPRIAEAIRQIRLAGGVAVLAHPHLYGWCNGSDFVSHKLLEKLSELQQAGLQGVEAFHGEASQMMQKEIAAAGKALNLLRTAGSDDHGDNKEHTNMYKAGASWLPAKEILVSAALINGPENDDEKTWLLARRAEPGFGHALWEVPGGKVESDETTAEALKRELSEELALNAEIGQIKHVLSHDYPGRRIILVFHEAFISDKWQLRVHDSIGYYTSRQALSMPLLAADVVLFQHLAHTEGIKMDT